MITGIGIGMEGCKRKDGFMKNHVTRNIDTSYGQNEALKPLVHITVPKKDASSGLKLKLVRIIWA
jgi:hypothetical protein